MQNDTIATGIMSFVMHELVYFGRSLPWIIIDSIPYFNKYKLQNVSGILLFEYAKIADTRLDQGSDMEGAVGVRCARPAQPLHC